MRRRCGLLKSDENRNFGPRLEPWLSLTTPLLFWSLYSFLFFGGNFVPSCCKLVKSSLSLDQEFRLPLLPITPSFLTVQREKKIF